MDESDIFSQGNGTITLANAILESRNEHNVESPPSQFERHISHVCQSFTFGRAVLSIRIMARATRDALQLNGLEVACGVLHATRGDIFELVAKARGISVLDTKIMLEKLCSVHQRRDPFYRAAHDLPNEDDSEAALYLSQVGVTVSPEDDAEEGMLTEVYKLIFLHISYGSRANQLNIQRFPGFFLSSPFDNASFIASKNAARLAKENGSGSADDDDDDDDDSENDDENVLYIQKDNGEACLVSGKHTSGKRVNADESCTAKRGNQTPFVGPPGEAIPSSPTRAAVSEVTRKGVGAPDRKRAKQEKPKPPPKKKREVTRSPSSSSSVQTVSENDDDEDSAASSRKKTRQTRSKKSPAARGASTQSARRTPKKGESLESGFGAQNTSEKGKLPVDDALVDQLLHMWRMATANKLVVMDSVKKTMSEAELALQLHRTHKDILHIDACLPCVHRFLHTSERGFRLLPFLKEICEHPSALAALLYLSCSGCQKAGLGKEVVTFFLNFLLELGVERNAIDMIADELYVIPRPVVVTNPESTGPPASENHSDQERNVTKQLQYLSGQDPRRRLLQIRPCETPFAHYALFQLVNQIECLKGAAHAKKVMGRHGRPWNGSGMVAGADISYVPDDSTAAVLAGGEAIPLALSVRSYQANLAPAVAKAMRLSKSKKNRSAADGNPSGLDALEIMHTSRTRLEEVARTVWSTWTLQDSQGATTSTSGRTSTGSAKPSAKEGKSPARTPRGVAKKPTTGCRIPRFSIDFHMEDLQAVGCLRMWERTRMRVFMDALIVLLRLQHLWSVGDASASEDAGIFVESHEDSIASSIQNRAALCVHACGNAFTTNPIGGASSDDYLEMLSGTQYRDPNDKSGDTILDALAGGMEKAFEKGQKCFAASPPPGAITVSLKAHQQESLWWSLRRERLGLTEYIAVPLPPSKEERETGASPQVDHLDRVLLYNPVIPAIHIVCAGSYSHTSLCKSMHGGMLCDEMGLGKTVVLLGLAASNPMPEAIDLSDEEQFPLLPNCEQEDVVPFEMYPMKSYSRGYGRPSRVPDSHDGLPTRYLDNNIMADIGEASKEDVALYNNLDLSLIGKESTWVEGATQLVSPLDVQKWRKRGRTLLCDLMDNNPAFQRTYVRRHRLIPSRATVVVVPVSLVGQWVSEIERYAPRASYLVFHGQKRHTYSVEDLQRVDFIVTTYETVASQVTSENDALENVFTDTMPHAETLDETEQRLASLVEYSRRQSAGSLAAAPVEAPRRRGPAAAAAAAAQRTFTDDEVEALESLKQRVSQAIAADQKRIRQVIPRHFLLRLIDNPGEPDARLNIPCGSEEDIRFITVDMLLSCEKPATYLKAANSHGKKIPILSRFKFHRLILDESQKFSAGSAIDTIHATYRWCSTGTPVNNKNINNLKLPMIFLGLNRTATLFSRPGTDRSFQDLYPNHLIRCSEIALRAVNMYLSRRGVRKFYNDIVSAAPSFNEDSAPDTQLVSVHTGDHGSRNPPAHFRFSHYGFFQCVCEGCSFQRVSGLCLYSESPAQGTLAVFPATVGLTLSAVMVRHVKTDVIRRSMGIPRCTIVPVPHDMLPDERVLYSQIEQIVINEFTLLSRRGLIGNRMGHVMVWIQILCRLALHPRVAQDEVLSGTATSLHVIRTTEAVFTSTSFGSTDTQCVAPITEELTPEQAVKWITTAAEEAKKRLDSGKAKVDSVPEDSVQCVQALAEVPPEFPQCTICLDMMSLPTITECYHLFCKECVFSVIFSARPTPQGMTTARCPLCRDRDSLRSKLRLISAHVSMGDMPADDADAETGECGGSTPPTTATDGSPQVLDRDVSVRRELSDMGLLRRSSSRRDDGAAEGAGRSPGPRGAAPSTPNIPPVPAEPTQGADAGNEHTVLERLARIGDGSRTREIMTLLGRIWSEERENEVPSVPDGEPSTTPYDNVIIFSKYPHYLHILSTALRNAGHSVSLIDGSTSLAQRRRILKTFQRPVALPSSEGAAAAGDGVEQDEELNEAGGEFNESDDDDKSDKDGNVAKRRGATKKRARRQRAASIDVDGDDDDESDKEQMDSGATPQDSSRHHTTAAPPTDGGRRVLLLSSRAANAGLNLTFANHLIFAEPNVNPSLEAQAIGRVHRYGQTKAIRVYHLYTQRTIEERLHDRMSRLLNSDMINNINEDDQAVQEAPQSNAASTNRAQGGRNTNRLLSRMVATSSIQFEFSEVAYLITGNQHFGQNV